MLWVFTSFPRSLHRLFLRALDSMYYSFPSVFGFAHSPFGFHMDLAFKTIKIATLALAPSATKRLKK